MNHGGRLTGLNAGESVMKEIEGVIGQLGRSTWYHVFLASTLTLGICMLFLQELPLQMQRFFVPGLAIYALGAAVFGYIQGIHFRKNGMKAGWSEPTIPYAVVHVVWFAFLIFYLIYRNVL